MMEQEASLNEVVEKCYHCGLDCDKEDVLYDEKHFCCQGCKTVYSLLTDNDLIQYYRLDKNPGNSLRIPVEDQKYAFLDNATIEEKLLEFKSDRFNKITFFIPSIHCSSCIWLLENFDRLEPGVTVSRVHFTKKELTLDYDPAVTTLRKIVSLLSSVGYEPVINLENAEKQVIQKSQNDLLIKVGVAGFCFGNIMLLSFPEYLGFDDSIDPGLQKIFSIISIILSLPVLLYCSTDYFRSSLYSITQKQINIDVPITLGIIALYTRSLYEIIVLQGSGYLDSFSGLIFFLLIGKWFQAKTYQGLSYDKDYKSYFPLSVTRLEKQGQRDVIATDLKKGDKIFVRNKELVPVDSILLGNSTNIDYSFVTGESTPVYKLSGDKIYAGGRQLGPGAQLEVQKEVSQSYLTRLWDSQSFKEDLSTRSRLLIDRISKYFTITVISIAILAAVIWAFQDVSIAVNVFSAVLILACPCALALSTPFTLGTAMSVLGKAGFYVKNTETIERLGKVNKVILDKTGTITYPEGSKITYKGKPLSSKIKSDIASIVGASTHPLSRQLVNHLGASIDKNVIGFQEVEGKGIEGRVDNSRYKIGSAEFVNITENENLNITNVHLTVNGVYHGTFFFSNLYRNGLEVLAKQLASRFELSVLTGDNDSERNTLKKILPHSANILFNQDPYDKLRYVQQEQNHGNKVLMIGDGLNDAGALKQADIGISVTDNILSFTPSSDVIIKGNRVTDLFDYLKFAKSSRRIIIISFIISFIYNVLGLGFAASGSLTPLIAAILMPLSSISIVVFTTTSVNLLANFKKLKYSNNENRI